MPGQPSLFLWHCGHCNSVSEQQPPRCVCVCCRWLVLLEVSGHTCMYVSADGWACFVTESFLQRRRTACGAVGCGGLERRSGGGATTQRGKHRELKSVNDKNPFRQPAIFFAPISHEFDRSRGLRGSTTKFVTSQDFRLKLSHLLQQQQNSDLNHNKPLAAEWLAERFQQQRNSGSRKARARALDAHTPCPCVRSSVRTTHAIDCHSLCSPLSHTRRHTSLLPSRPDSVAREQHLRQHAAVFRSHQCRPACDHLC